MERPIHRLLHLLLAVGLVHALFLIAQEGVRAYHLAKERAHLEAEVKAKEREVAELKARLQAAQDPAYLEALVRRLGWVRKEERLIPLFPKPEALP